MFDEYYAGGLPRTTTVNVTENKAPTAESVRLLREMEKAAQDQLVHVTSVKDTNISAIIHTHKSHLSDTQKFRVIYSFNGKKLTTDYECDDRVNGNVFIHGLIDALAKDIALHILQKPFSEMMKSHPELKPF